jgi:hypothetical protein
MGAPAAHGVLPLVLNEPPGTRWFSSNGCVVWRDERVEVVVGGTLIASFAPGDRGARNVALVGLADDPSMHFGKLAAAFDLHEETLRHLRRQRETGGLARLLENRTGGRVAAVGVGSVLQRKLEALFEQGKTIAEVHKLVSRRHRIGRSTVGRARQAWAQSRESARAEAGDQEPAPKGTAQLMLGAPEPKSAAAPGPTYTQGTEPEPEPAAPEDEHDTERVAAAPRSADNVQHAGSWLLVGMVHALGLHERAAVIAEGRARRNSLRLALDA